jgi:hypothetical protein
MQQLLEGDTKCLKLSAARSKEMRNMFSFEEALVGFPRLSRGSLGLTT